MNAMKVKSIGRYEIFAPIYFYQYVGGLEKLLDLCKCIYENKLFEFHAIVL